MLGLAVQAAWNLYCLEIWKLYYWISLEYHFAASCVPKSKKPNTITLALVIIYI